MPARSKAQHRLMRAALRNPGVRRRTGVDLETARELVRTTKSAHRLPERRRNRSGRAARRLAS